MSEFDPQERALSPFQRRLRRFLPERHIMVRSKGEFRAFTLTSAHQVAGLCAGLALAGWVSYGTAALFWMDDIIEAKNARIDDARDAYKTLLAEVSVYKAKVGEVTRALEANHSQFRNLVGDDGQVVTPAAPAAPPSAESLGGDGKASFLDEQRRFDREQQTLMAQLSTLDQGLNDLSQARLLLTDFDTIELEMRKVVIQRDLALTETRELQGQVATLEEHLRDMEAVQQDLVERYADLADTRIAHVRDALEPTGLDIQGLMMRRTGPYGQGGPFLPINLPQGSPEQANAVARLVDRLDQWAMLRGVVMKLPLDRPLPPAYALTSTFGVRPDPVNGLLSLHEGADMGAPIGTDIRVTAPGKVVYAGWRGRYGRVVEVDHGQGISTRYAHLDSFGVSLGQTVKRGDVVGTVGNSGRSTGPHLHYEVRVNGKPRDPVDFMKAGSNVFKG